VKVFIYGAGASYSAQTNVQNPSFKAPLTNELFDDKYSVFATQIGISEYDLNKYKSEVANSQTLEACVRNTITSPLLTYKIARILSLY
jgi:hypothetical protein